VHPEAQSASSLESIPIMNALSFISLPVAVDPIVAELVDVAPAIVAPVVAPAPTAIVVTDDTPAARAARAELTATAREEVAWFLSPCRSKAAGAVQARRTIRGWLATLPKRHRAALSLTFSNRCLSRRLDKATTRSVPLLVQLYAKKYGTPKYSVVKVIERQVKCEGCEVLWDLETRADLLFRRAVILYRRARGDGPSVIPWNAK
jgi:hypothetical protein